jgi:hypothetical protein
MTTETSAEIRRQILDTEARRIRAMIDEDIPSLAAILADELTYTHSGGRYDTRQSFLDLIAAPATHYLGVDFSDDTEVMPLGEQAALVRGVAALRLKHADEPDEIRYSVMFLDVYHLRDGRWQMVAWQATRVPESK